MAKPGESARAEVKLVPDGTVSALPGGRSVANARAGPTLKLRLIQVGDVDPTILEFLALSLHDLLDVRCHVEEGSIDIADTLDRARQQYHSSEILSRLLPLTTSGHERILGVADVDLFIPILTYVFGEAQLSGPTALVSVRRLRQEFYGLPADERALFLRAEKEAVHELGHTFGLVHCKNFECVMRSSNSVEQVDLKSSDFCEDCAAKYRETRRRLAERRDTLAFET